MKIFFERGNLVHVFFQDTVAEAFFQTQLLISTCLVANVPKM